MERTTASLETRARSIFDDLGYTVVGDGPTFRAERDWKVVQVTATDGPADPHDDGLHCYVTATEHAADHRRRLAGSACEEWAIIAIDEEDYEVVRAPPGPAT